MGATSTTMVHVRVKQRLKRKAEKALQSMGLSVSDAVRILLTRVVAEQRFPLELEVPNARSKAAKRELEEGGGKRHVSAEEMFKDLEI